MKLRFMRVEPPPWVSPQDWSDWKWHSRHALKDIGDFENYFTLSEEERLGFQGLNQLFQVRVTPYYARLAHPENPQDPIRKILMPQARELSAGYQQMLDPLGEHKHSPVPRVIHRYPDRVLLLVTDFCSVYCRYCTRKHFTGQDQAVLKNEDLAGALEYIRSRPGIREVILSGGDPLTLSDSQLEKILTAVREIEHVEIIRLGTRMPVVAPMRVTQELVAMLRRYNPIFVMTHFNHPREVTEEAAQALSFFVDHGLPVMNQMVLLNGVNNHEAIVQALSRRLLYLRVKPYYMFQCDPSEGTDHLRTSVEDSMHIQRELWGRLSGLAVPNLSLDIPDGGGKTGLVPNFQIDHQGERRTFKGWDGIESEYISPPAEDIQKPADIEEYLAEWEAIKNSPYGR